MLLISQTNFILIKIIFMLIIYIHIYFKVSLQFINFFLNNNLIFNRVQKVY